MDGLEEIRAALEKLDEAYFALSNVTLAEGDWERIEDKLAYIQRKLERALKERELAAALEQKGL